MSTGQVGVVALAVAWLAVGSGRAAGQDQPPDRLLFGRDVRLMMLEGGGWSRGELLGVTADSLQLLPAGGPPRSIALADVTRIDVALHGFGWKKVLTWSAIGALVTGVAMTAACTGVEDATCGAVFPAVLLTWGLVGGLAGSALSASRWQAVSPSADGLRRFSRYPQGAPHRR